jgi:hypothetical protein
MKSSIKKDSLYLQEVNLFDSNDMQRIIQNHNRLER